ncbi:hypothetical protein D3C87_1512790 [compost metagenome]
MTRVRKSVGTNHAELWQSKWRAKVFPNITRASSTCRIYLELHSTWNYRNFPGLNLHHADLGFDLHLSTLNNEKKISISIHEVLVTHRL